MRYLEDKKLLNLRFSNGMLILPFIRYELMCHINDNQTSASVVKYPSKRKKLFRIFLNLLKIRFKRSDIVYFSSTLFNTKDEKGFFFNSLHGYYYNLFPRNSLLIEDADEQMEWRTMDSYTNLSFINTYILFFSSLFANISNKLRKVNNPDFNYIVDKYSTKFTVEQLSYCDYLNRFYSFFLKLLFKRCRCKVIFVNCGAYGGVFALLIKTASDLGIKVIEIQHGSIDGNHLAYHTDQFIANDKEYLTYLPSSFWTFGEYWTQYIEWKFEIIPVGNPHLNKYSSLYDSDKKIIDYLIISQPAIRDDLLTFVADLAERVLDKSIVIRLHPRDDKSFYAKALSSYTNVSFSNSTINLYSDIACSQYIVGGFSTCLYEALAFRKNPIIIETPLVRNCFPRNIGEWVTNASELLQMESLQGVSVEVEYYWKGNFEENVKQLLGKYIL